MSTVSDVLIRTWRCAALAAALLLAIGAPALAQDRVNTGYLGNVAIKGYDPVAYFLDGGPRKGSPDISQKWLGAIWYFSTAAHREAFVSHPTRFAPQYGGFCALGVAFEEAAANIDPEAWRIVDGRLYLFSGKEGLEQDFDASAREVIAKADTNWPKIAAAEFQARAAAK
jgi:hypothetical protein